MNKVDSKNQFTDQDFIALNNKLNNRALKEPKTVDDKYNLFKQQFNAVQEERFESIGGNKDLFEDQDKANNEIKNAYDDELNKSFRIGQRKYASVPKRESAFKDVDQYMGDQQKAYNHAKKSKILNFCSPLFKKYKRDNEHVSKIGYQDLINKIRESSMKVNQIKTGQSLFGKGDIIIDQQIPVLKDEQLKSTLVQLVEKGQFELSVNPSKKNLQFMECLEPPKFVEQYQRRLLNKSVADDYSPNKSSMITQTNEFPSQVQMLPFLSKKNSIINNNNDTGSIKNRQNSIKYNNSFSMDNTFITEAKKEFTVSEYNPQEIKTLKKSFDFPINPAFLSRSAMSRTKKLKFLTEHCKSKNIAMSKNEEIIMSLDISKMKHQLWKNQVSKLYDHKDYRDETQELIGLLDDFEKFKFSRNDIQKIIDETQIRQLRKRMGWIELKPKSILEDEGTFLGLSRKQSFLNKRNVNQSVDQISKGLLMKRQSNYMSFKIVNKLRQSITTQSNSSVGKEDSVNSQKASPSPPNKLQSKKTGFQISSHLLNEQLIKIQKEKKLQDEEKVRKYNEFDDKRKEVLKKLRRRLDNPSQLNQAQLIDKNDDSEIKIEIDVPEALKKKSIIKLIKATDKIYERRVKINKNLQKLIKRIDLDRPLVLREKLDIIWKETKTNKSAQNSPQRSKSQDKYGKEEDERETYDLGIELEKRKQARTTQNNKQRDSYNKLLIYLEKKGRTKFLIQNEEKQLMNILKIVIDCGWIVKGPEFEQILSMVKIQNKPYLEMKQVREFFLMAAKEFNYREDKIKQLIKLNQDDENDVLDDFHCQEDLERDEEERDEDLLEEIIVE